jgi:serine protease Do
MFWRRILFLLALVALLPLQSARAQGDLNDELEKATKDAVKKASPSVVQIVTQGGSDIVVVGLKGQEFRKGLGPTTGVVVDADGYIISSAFNFINNPTTILVSLPGKTEPVVAQRVATDRSRMLTLLKVDVKGLPVPAFVPRKEIAEGQWSIALGRTLDARPDGPPSVSVGVISALNRIWGKAIQADCKTSPINYGGPIIDIAGRVQAILIPASPSDEEATAGFEWYDSGIAFAIPMEDVMAVLPRLKSGKDLQKGLLVGLDPKAKDLFASLPPIGTLPPGSPLAIAGVKQGDVVVEVDGKAVVRMAQLLHALGHKYEGDKVSLKLKRGDQTIEVKDVELGGKNLIVAQPYLGIIPLRDDPKLGVEIAHVFDKSPADKAGLKVGDRILKFGVGDTLKPFVGATKLGRAELLEWLNTLSPGVPVKLEVKRKDGKTDTVTAVLDPLPGAVAGLDFAIPEKLPNLTAKKALDPIESGDPNVKPPMIVEKAKPKFETGLFQRNTPDGEHKFWVYVHEDYDPNVAHGLVVWLHPPGKNKEDDIKAWKETWEDFCADNHLILVAPLSENENGWIPSESEFVTSGVREVLKEYTIDRQRIVAHGMGVGGQMAMHLGFNHRDLFRGVVSLGAVVVQTKDNTPTQRVAFYLAAGELDPLSEGVAKSVPKLQDKRYSVVYRPIAKRGREYFEEAQIRDVLRWIAVLDKL